MKLKAFEDEIRFSAATKKLARLWVNELSGIDGTSPGDALLKALWEKAQRRIHPGGLEMIFEQQGMDDEVLHRCGLKRNPN